MPLVSVIIVNYNVQYFLEQCLYSVQKALEGIEGEIIVVDNHSTDGSLDWLPAAFPAVRFMANAQNSGFSRANNQGWRGAGGQYILFLNPDTLLAEDSLRHSLAVLEADAGIGALGIRMVDGSGHYLPESKRGTPTARVSLYKLTGLTRLFPRSPVFARYYLGHLSPYQSQEVEVLAGAYMLVRRTVLEETGGFDERFFMYAEDVDLSYRIRQAGYRNWYLADSAIVHFKGESTRKNAAYVTMFYQAMTLFVEKHYGKKARWYALLLRVAIRVRALAAQLGRRRAPAPGTRESRPGPILLVGTPGARQEARAILEKQAPPAGSLHEAAPQQDIRALIKTHCISEVLYCANGFLYKDIISGLQALPPGITARFHAAGSRSIVGSRHKDRGGETLAR